MNAEDIKHLESYGFAPFYDDSYIMSAFEHPIYALDAKIYTQGEHSDERTLHQEQATAQSRSHKRSVDRSPKKHTV